MLIDSNIIIYALNSGSPKCKVAQNFISQNQSSMVIAQQNIFETLRILTHPKFPRPFSSEKALLAVSAITKHAEIIHPNSETQEIAFALIKKYRLSGAEIFDGLLVATALTHKIQRIATNNLRHFNKYKEIDVISPF